MKDIAVARRYARALFQMALQLDQMQATLQGLKAAVAALRTNDSIVSVLLHPGVSAQDKHPLFKTMLGEYATPLLEKFFSLLITRHRFDLISFVVAAFQQEVDAHDQVRRVKMQSASPLSASQAEELQRVIETTLGQKVRLEQSTNPDLLAGVVIQTEGWLLDGSLQGQLAQLKNQLTRND